MSEWKEVKLGDVCEVIGGGTPSTKRPEYWNGNISWITPKDLSNYQKKYIFSGERNITEKGLKNSSTKILPKGTILFTSRAPIGYIAIAGKELCTNQGFKSLICKKEMYNQFLYYLMKYKTNEIIKLANGSTFKEISGTNLKKLPIKLPPFPIQKKIADILSVIDEKIETLQNINETLEEMAKTIFKSWFVDFDIVKAKVSGKSDREIAKEFGINEKIVKLFPSEFVYSEIGKIPKGWKVKKLGDYIELLNGYAFKSKTFVKNGKYGIVTIKNVKQSYFETKCENYINELPANIKNYQILKAGDILISLTGNVGRVCIVTGKNYLLNQRVGKLKSKVKNFYSLGYFLFLQKELFNKLQNLAKGTAQKNLSPVETSQIKIILPNNINKFSYLFENFFEKIKYNLLQIQTLQELRDILLPKLINGEIEVDELNIKGIDE